MELALSAEVTAARAAGTPIVALESTIIAHGLPWPDNFDVALALEAAVRARGAVPATIAVVDGVPCIGLGASQLEQLARDGGRFAKASATDLAIHLARGTSAATTVSATCVLAARAGLRVFATGGIGGVHRGDSDDVSHDLVALANTPIVVVSAGAKAILDLTRTLEQLETLGVLVIGYRTDEFPSFYGRKSGLRLEHRVDQPRELARIARAHWQLGGGGVLACNPIPADDVLDLDAPLANALAAARTEGVTGKRLTPFVLAKLADITHGASIRANRALALSNAEVAAHVAVELATEEAV